MNALHFFKCRLISSNVETNSDTDPNFNIRSISSAQPITVRTETERRNDVTVFQSMKLFIVIQVPQHSFAILSNDKS